MTELNTFLIMAQAIVVVPVWWLTLTVICASHALLLASKCLHMLLASSCNQCFGSQVLFLSTNVGPHSVCGILHIVWPLFVRDGPAVPRMVWWLISETFDCKQTQKVRCNLQRRSRKQSKHVKPSLPISKFKQPFSFLHMSFTNIPTQIDAHEISWRA